MSQDKPNTEETANNPEGLADAKSEEKNQQEAAKEVAAAKDEVEVEPMEEAAKKEGISYAEGLRKVKEGEMVAIPRNGEMYFYNQTQFNHLFMHSKDVFPLLHSPIAHSLGSCAPHSLLHDSLSP